MCRKELKLTNAITFAKRDASDESTEMTELLLDCCSDGVRSKTRALPLHLRDMCLP